MIADRLRALVAELRAQADHEQQALEHFIAHAPIVHCDAVVAALRERLAIADRLDQILAEDAGGWRPIAEAPRDGTIITATGWDWGRVGGRRHINRCAWQNGKWIDATSDGSILTYLTHYHVGASLEPPPQEPQP